MPDTPYNEPAEIRAGDTITWKKSVPDYPATDGWTLKYAFRNKDAKINVTAGADGGDYLSTLAAATSATLSAGRYDWIAYISKGSGATLIQYTVDEGSTRVLSNLSTDAAYDARSDARKIYDDLITKYKALAAGAAHVLSYNTAGRGTTYRSMKDMTDVIQFWYKQVRDEEIAEAVANGNANPRQVQVRLSRR